MITTKSKEQKTTLDCKPQNATVFRINWMTLADNINGRWKEQIFVVHFRIEDVATHPRTIDDETFVWIHKCPVMVGVTLNTMLIFWCFIHRLCPFYSWTPEWTDAYRRRIKMQKRYIIQKMSRPDRNQFTNCYSPRYTFFVCVVHLTDIDVNHSAHSPNGLSN